MLIEWKTPKKFFEKTTPNLLKPHVRHSGGHGWRSLCISQGKKCLLSGKLQKKFFERITPNLLERHGGPLGTPRVMFSIATENCIHGIHTASETLPTGLKKHL